MTKEKIYFASDFHLGSPTLKDSHKREKLIVSWLNDIEKNAKAVYLVGDVFEVAKDSFSEIGAENGEGFLSAKDIGLDITTSFDYVPKTSLNQAQGITVNTIHGNNDSIKEVMSRLRPDLESMEGAAFMMICQRFNIKFIQVRSVSNFVEERNKDNWNLDLAIKNLNHTVRMIINDL